MNTCVSPPSFAVMVNGGSSSFFKSTRGLRKGDDPLSPLLFIFVMEAQHKLIEKAKEVGLVKGIQVGREGTQIEISHLFFADESYLWRRVIKARWGSWRGDGMKRELRRPYRVRCGEHIRFSFGMTLGWGKEACRSSFQRFLPFLRIRICWLWMLKRVMNLGGSDRLM